MANVVIARVPVLCYHIYLQDPKALCVVIEKEEGVPGQLYLKNISGGSIQWKNAELS